MAALRRLLEISIEILTIKTVRKDAVIAQSSSHTNYAQPYDFL